MVPRLLSPSSLTPSRSLRFCYGCACNANGFTSTSKNSKHISPFARTVTTSTKTINLMILYRKLPAIRMQATSNRCYYYYYYWCYCCSWFQAHVSNCSNNSNSSTKTQHNRHITTSSIEIENICMNNDDGKRRGWGEKWQWNIFIDTTRTRIIKYTHTHKPNAENQ